MLFEDVKENTFSSPQRGSFLSTTGEQLYEATATVIRFRPLNGVLFYLPVEERGYDFQTALFSSPQRGSFLSTD